MLDRSNIKSKYSKIAAQVKNLSAQCQEQRVLHFFVFLFYSQWFLVVADVEQRL